MPKRAYKAWSPSPASLKIVAQATRICEAYAAAGYNLTLRQLYYQFVARDLLPNNMQSYKRLGAIINDARLGGLLDWNYLVDRTRNLSKLAQWATAEDAMDAIARQFRTMMWSSQQEYVEVWVEKEALADVVSRPADRWFVPYFSCRGYVSQSEMWAAAQRLLQQERQGRKTHVIHLGDHDPSGKDMTRDIEDRLWTFGSMVEVHRIALNMDQVLQYDPPPNPAKITDSRAEGYIEQYGDQSWELDALEPQVLDELIEGEILEHLDRDQWDRDHAQMEAARAVLYAVRDNWDDVTEHARTMGWLPEREDED